MASGKLTVYYDRSCPWCDSEMCAIKARDAFDTLAIVDCSAEDFADIDERGVRVTRADMMERLHVLTEEGEWLVGIPAYEAILAATGFARLARIVGHPRLRPVLDRTYRWLARNRHRFPRQALARWLLSRRARNARAA